MRHVCYSLCTYDVLGRFIADDWTWKNKMRHDSSCGWCFEWNCLRVKQNRLFPPNKFQKDFSKWSYKIFRSTPVVLKMTKRKNLAASQINFIKKCRKKNIIRLYKPLVSCGVGKYILCIKGREKNSLTMCQISSFRFDSKLRSEIFLIC